MCVYVANTMTTNSGAGTKSRININLAADVVQMADQLCQRERRSLSNMLEVLIDREFHQSTAPINCPKDSETTEIAA